MARLVFLLVPQLHLLDLAGPAQVFSTAADLGYRYELHYVAEQPELPTAQGAVIQAALRWPDLGPDDLIVVPGWRAPTLARTGPLSESATHRLTEHHARGGTVASVCAGADVLGRACWTDGAAPPTTTCKRNWPAAIRRPSWSATCCMSPMAGW